MVVGCLGNCCCCFICKLPGVVGCVHLFAGAVCVLLLRLNTDEGEGDGLFGVWVCAFLAGEVSVVF